MPPRPRTRTARPRSPISASGSTWRSPRRCRSLPATAPTSSASCKEALGDRADFQVVGDRFVFPSDVLFDFRLRRAEAGGHRPARQARRRAEASSRRKIPPDIAWVMRVDGHTDIQPIATPEFPSNWELSSARAISVVRYLMQQGVPAERLVAAGFGEFQPIDAGDERRGSGQEPPHRAQAHRALGGAYSAASGANCSSASRV